MARWIWVLLGRGGRIAHSPKLLGGGEEIFVALFCSLGRASLKHDLLLLFVNSKDGKTLGAQGLRHRLQAPS